MSGKPYVLPAHTILPEPKLLFSSTRTDLHPLRGLTEFGPYSADLGYPEMVRLAYFCPPEFTRKLDGLVAELNGRAMPREATNYYVEYPGFERTFRARLVPASETLRIPAPGDCARLAEAGDGDGLAQAIIQALAPLSRVRSSFDVLLIHLPKAWSHAFEYEGFNLHDIIKARLAPRNIPVQIVNDATWERRCRAQVMWGISVALYAKAGGIPWKLADHDRDEAYIGLSYAIKRHRDGHDYATCCSQVFDPDGTGFEFVAFDAREITTDRKGNPFLSYAEMQAVLSKSLLLYQNGHRGRIPRKLFIHKSSHFTDDEILGAHDAFGGRTELELIQVVRKTGWYGIKIEGPRHGAKAAPAAYSVDRGVYQPVSPTECLLWTQGSVVGVNPSSSHKPVFKEAPLKPLPDPILLRRFSGAGGWHDTCASILSLTKVDWNNNTLYKTLPATLVYSSLFANVVKHAPDIVDEVYDYRFFM
ncbi:argonaute/piwi family protein [Microvirga guangxiensis]|uniref:Piwi domain-containing protein n=1 Tax=Microvirga guangxiensis TaxID=549386 RepID=A0A1G5HNF1_9HYPH|nr:nuclease PIN [Microvirga guangxiensis]SCY65405.1 hypothetical protein SAMN02927923_01839 [Microvirga guangxiensis]